MSRSPLLLCHTLFCYDTIPCCCCVPIIYPWLPRSELVLVWCDGDEVLQLWQDDASWTSGRTQVNMQLVIIYDPIRLFRI